MEKDGDKINKKKGKLVLHYSLYSNGFSIKISENEIVIDFLQEPADDLGNIRACRIIAIPKNFKKFLGTFNGVIKQYEKDYGELVLEDKKKKSKKTSNKKK